MLATATAIPFLPFDPLIDFGGNKGRKIFAHLWMYASRFPPNWDSTPILDTIFKDFQEAGLDGIEVMDANLRNPGIVDLLNRLIEKYKMPVIGASFYGDMWNTDQHETIRKDAELVIGNLSAVGARHIGITVGDAGRKKTEDELDAQALMLREVMEICERNGIAPNLHNHTFEMQYDRYDFLGTLKRVPEINLGPDVNWLIRAGIDPVDFILAHGDKITFIHFRDQFENGKWTNYLGEGVTDFKAIAKALEAIKYKGDYTIELAYEEPPEHEALRDLKISRDFVHKVFIAD